MVDRRLAGSSGYQSDAVPAGAKPSVCTAVREESERPRTPAAASTQPWRGLMAFVSVLFMAVALVTTVNGQTASAPAERRIVNVHEHLQALSEIPKLLAAMDAVGIRKTILVGSPLFTFTLNPTTRFAGYTTNNDMLLKATGMHPDRFEAWPTLDPEDPDKLTKLKGYVAKGATGLKLYLGHGHRQKGRSGYTFHRMAMDDPRMVPVYAYAQEKNIPVMFHVNPGPTKPGFAEEFVAVLKRFPDMKVIAPHFILSSIKESRLREFLDTFPNLYSDISFGRDPYLKTGLTRISRRAKKFRDLFAAYPDRFMFGSDVVITTSQLRTEAWLADRFRAYVDMLTKKSYEAVIGTSLRLQGLGLSPGLSQRILYENFEAFKAKRPSGTKIVRAIDWTAMGIQPTKEKGRRVAGPVKEKDWAVLRQEALAGKEASIRSRAVDGLARKGDERRALEILMEVLKKDPVVEVRGDALSAIEFFEPVPKKPVLDAVIADRAAALRLQALGIIEDEDWQGDEIHKTLLAATNDSDEEVRLAALSLLGEMEAWAVLEEIEKQHRHQKIRELAAELLKDK